jgi:hypothetical protein
MAVLNHRRNTAYNVTAREVNVHQTFLCSNKQLPQTRGYKLNVYTRFFVARATVLTHFDNNEGFLRKRAVKEVTT